MTQCAQDSQDEKNRERAHAKVSVCVRETQSSLFVTCNMHVCESAREKRESARESQRERERERDKAGNALTLLNCNKLLTSIKTYN
jgi:hypothetical protein